MAYAVPIIFVVLIWWFLTGAILWLATRSGGRQPGSLAGMIGLGVLGFVGIYASSFIGNGLSPYIAFLSALAIWAMIEFTFLTGLLTGPRSVPCPENISEPERFRLAFLTISHHEFALLAALFAIGFVSLAAGQVMSFATFALLWLMRISAKLTLFSGAPGFSVDMMPTRLVHMRSYFRHDRIGIVFWTSTFLSTFVFACGTFLLVTGGIAPEFFVFAVMLNTLLGLGVLEHWFMVLPVPDSALWRWALPGPAAKSRDKDTKQQMRAEPDRFIATRSETACQSRTGVTL